MKRGKLWHVKKMRATISLGVLLSLFGGSVLGEPTPAIRHLMNEPVSLFDWGIARIQKRLRSFFKDFSAPNIDHIATVANYDWDKNRIVIATAVDHNGKNAKQACKTVLRAIKEDLSANMGLLFSHIGYQEKDRPKNLDSEIDNITEIIVVVRASQAESVTRCKSPLLGTEIFFPE